MSAGNAPALREDALGGGGGGRRAALTLPNGVDEDVIAAEEDSDVERRAGIRRGWGGEPGCAKSLSVTVSSTADGKASPAEGLLGDEGDSEGMDAMLELAWATGEGELECNGSKAWGLSL